jgi:hypothetical protein
MMEFLKEKRLESKKYLVWIRSNECFLCKHPAETAHHIRKHTDGGVALKPSDCFTVPLCHYCHDRVHKNPYYRVKNPTIKDAARMLFKRLEETGEIKYATDKLREIGEFLFEEIER